MSRGLGIDVGGTHLRVALVEQDGEVVSKASQAIVDPSAQGLLQQMHALAQEVSGGELTMPVAVGLAAQIWLATGDVAVAPI
ncbi:MAG: hypothetical protein R3C68_17240 [Myxococcota bacterium]